MSPQSFPVRRLLHEIAHLAHVELFTPEPEASLDFFVRTLGLTENGREGDSVYLRTWDDYEHHSLKLTASSTSGVGKTGLRASSQEALERRIAAIEERGLGIGWKDGDPGIGPTYLCRDPDGHEIELYWETERYRPPAELAPALKNQAQAYPGRGVSVRHLNHVNYLAEDSGANGDFICDALGARVTEQILLDSGVISGRWTHFNQKSYDLVYTNDRTARAVGCATSRSAPTPARTSCAPPTSAWTTACSSRPARTSTPSSRRSSSTSTSPAATGSSCATPPAGW